MIFKLRNPIPPTVKHRDELNQAIRKWQGIPYYGTREGESTNFLSILQTLAELSGTFSAAISDINYYTFGQNLEICDNVMPGMVTEVDPLEFDQQFVFIDWLKELGITAKKVIKISRTLNHHLEVSGNAYLFLRRVQVNSVVKYSAKAIHYKHFMYRYNNDIAEDECLISKFLDDYTMLEKYPPKILQVTKDPDEIIWNEAEEQGVEEAVIHIKILDEDGESDFYSRSKLIPILTWLYTDFKIGDLNSKIAGTELITKKILAFQAPDPTAIMDYDDDGDDTTAEEHEAMGIKYKSRKNNIFTENMLKLKRLVSNVATHPSNSMDGPAANTIAGIQYPHSGQAPTTIDLEMNRDTKHQEFQVDKAISFICQALRWSPELLMVRQTKATLGGNLLYDIFTMKNETTIRPKALEFEDLWNSIFNQIKDRESADRTFQNYGIKFPDVISEMISRFKGNGSNANIGENPVRNNTGLNAEEDGEPNADDSTIGAPV